MRNNDTNDTRIKDFQTFPSSSRVWIIKYPMG